MANDIMGLIDAEEALEFSRNLDISRNYAGDLLFPDRKTQFLKADYTAISQVGLLPTIAPVHAYDTEAVIGERPAFQEMQFDKLLLKKKINQSERLQAVLSYGMTANNVKARVFDDLAYLFDSVKASTELRKMAILGLGEIPVFENNLEFTVDIGMPADNHFRYDWDDPDHNIMADIQDMVDAAADMGAAPDMAMTSNTIVRKIARNTSIQTQLYGSSGVGSHVSLESINALFSEEFGFVIMKNDDKYAEEIFVGGRKARSTARFFSEDSFSLFTTDIDGTAGIGLWGPTPEETARYSNAWDVNREQLYVTLTQWADQDPAVVWSKASGLFMPVFPDPTGLFIATITPSTVDVPIEDIELFAGTQYVTVGNTLPLTAEIDPTNATNKTLAWASSSDAIATVSAQGVVTAVAAGEVEITATAQDGSGVSDSIEITVVAA